MLGSAGCDTAVDPIRENDRHYSIFGVLNASAAVQFVRVEALRDSLPIGAPTELDAEATLTDVTEGRTVTLQDSVFSYSGGIYAHNFYTTHDIRPAHTYRLTVRSADGAESSAQVRVPDAFPEPTVVAPIPPDGLQCRSAGGPTVVEMQGIERLVAVKVLYYLLRRGEREPRVRSFGHLEDAERMPDGSILAYIEYQKDLCAIQRDIGGGGLGEDYSIGKVEVVVAAGNPDWPDFLNLDWETVALPGGASNVEGGVGLLGGVVTDTVRVFPP